MHGKWRARWSAFLLVGGLIAAGAARADAPWLEWVEVMGGVGAPYLEDRPNGIVADAFGNVFSAGLMPDQTVAEYNEAPGKPGYIAKHNHAGELEWMVRYPGEIFALTVDDGGNVYAAGYAAVPDVDLDPGPGTWTPDTWAPDGQSHGALFVVVFTNDGHLAWAWTTKWSGAPDAPWIMPRSLLVDADGSVFVAGTFSGTFEFGPEPGQNRLSKPYNQDYYDATEIFVCKIHPGGETAWARQTLSLFNRGRNQVAGIALDEHGDVVVRAHTDAYGVDFGTADTVVEDLPIEQEGRYSPPRDEGRFLYALDRQSGECLRAQTLSLDALEFSPHLEGAVLLERYDVPSDDWHHMVIANLDAHARIIWTWELPLPSRNAALHTRFASDAAGNVYGSITVTGLIAFPEGRHSPAIEVEWGVVLLKWSPRGELEWTFPVTAYGGDHYFPVYLDANGMGGVFALGIYSGVADFGGHDDETLVDAGPNRKVYTLKLNELPKPVHGDVDGDGTVNATDVQLVINAALGLPVDSAHRVDITGSGGVNAVDVQQVINAVLGISGDSAGEESTAQHEVLTPEDERPSSPVETQADSIADSDAPWLEWVHTMGGEGRHGLDFGSDIAVDAAGNVFTVGSMFDVPAAGSGLVEGNATYLAKHTPEGELAWLVQYPMHYLSAVAVNGAGDVYAVGALWGGSFDLDPGPDTLNADTFGTPTMIVLKFSNDGELLWAWAPELLPPTGQSPPEMRPLSIAVDHEDALFITGQFRGEYDFGPDRLSKPESPVHGWSQATEVFVCKLDAAGAVQWARQTMSIHNAGSNDGGQLVLDDFGDPVITGRAGDLPFVVGTAVTDSEWFPPVQDGVYMPPQRIYPFHLKLDSHSGELQWVRPLHEEHVAYSDAQNGPGFVQVIQTDREGPNAITIGKFDPNGDLYWAWSLPNTAYIAGWASRVVMDADGNVYASLPHVNSRDVPAGRHTPAFHLERGTLLLKLDPGGTLEWAYPVFDHFSSAPIALTVDGHGGVYATGQFQNTVDFGGLFEEFPVTTGHEFTVFTLKLSAFPPELPPLVPGDVNGDGVVNALDVQLVINAALGLPLEPGFDADVTGSGTVDATDVQTVINLALGNGGG